MKITPKQYAKLILDLAGRASNEQELNEKISMVTELIIKNHDRHMLDKIIAQLDAVYLIEYGKTRVEITSVHKLSEAQLSLVKERIVEARSVDREDLTIVTKQDQSLVGGVKVRIGDEVLDGSIKSKLARLQSSLA